MHYVHERAHNIWKWQMCVFMTVCVSLIYTSSINSIRPVCQYKYCDTEAQWLTVGLCVHLYAIVYFHS